MSQNNLSVAIIEPVGGHGGMNYYDFGLAGGLAKNGNIVLYTSEETYVPKQLLFEVKKTFKGIWGSSPKLIRAVRFVYCLYTTLKDAKKNSLQVVHFHFFHYTNLEALCVRLAKIYGFKIVATVHDVECFSGNHNRRKSIKILSDVNEIIAHNYVSKRELLEVAASWNSKISIIPHGNFIDFVNEFPGKNAARENLNLSRNDKVLLFFGHIKKVKGLDILLESLPEVVKSIPNIKLVIAGKVWKGDFSIYQKIIKENKLEDYVVPIIKFIPDLDLAKYYNASDLVVLPYKKIYQSGVLLMAMSYKVPVLASDIPGMVEIVSDEENGYVFPSENVSSLSSKIIEVLSDEKTLSRIGQSGYETVVNNYCWDKIGKLTCEVYRR